MAESPKRKVRPLTRRTESGELYRRSPETERQIEEVLNLSDDALIKRVKTSEANSPLWLKEETLVYLLREAIIGSRDPLREAVMDALTERIEPRLRNHARTFVKNEADAEDCFQEAVTEVFFLLLEPNDTRGEFAQIRFGRFLKLIGIRFTERFTDESKRAQHFVYTDEDEDDAHKELEAPKTLDPVELLDMQRGLKQLAEPYKAVFILYHYVGMKIESKDQSVPTISKLYRTSEKTIRNWLKRAEQILKQWRGEKDE